MLKSDKDWGSKKDPRHQKKAQKDPKTPKKDPTLHFGKGGILKFLSHLIDIIYQRLKCFLLLFFGNMGIYFLCNLRGTVSKQQLSVLERNPCFIENGCVSMS